MRVYVLIAVLVLALGNIVLGSVVFLDDTQAPGVLWARLGGLTLGVVSLIALAIWLRLTALSNRHFHAAAEIASTARPELHRW
ncbi:hypothetical protein EV649_5014 [Kribbella sp. VKM Ac-2569]|uniref:hypothetical protein n=1 Tax=Kribbella sp. VKM Ac-2569 TaxID=2512220 RepID=UPI00102B9B2C|nr:hypothetical protein [Kribbella sp. VKM Ac-2569]RZT17468.1 hypothetical protein EV649_5014 [Kribbella sp. VKM Ac-2569]